MPAAQPPAPVPSGGPARGSLILIRPDGSEGEAFPLEANETRIGRDAGGIFSSDSYLSPGHAVFRFDAGQLRVTDADSLNGVYVRIAPEQPHELIDGAIFRIGQEIIRFELMKPPASPGDGIQLMGSPDPGFIGRMRLVIGRETHGNSYCVPPDGMHLGRERGDIIFPDDGYVSGLHCRIHKEGGKVLLTDVGSSNGTFIRVRGDHSIPAGSMILMGQQLFRVEYQ
ncbi:MAG: FHA domain-containing protein [Myxococcota bacterium]